VRRANPLRNRRGFWRRAGLAGVAAALVAVVIVVTAIVVSTPGVKRRPSAAEPACASGTLGVYAGAEQVQKVAALGQSMGCRPTFAMEFLNADSWNSISQPGQVVGPWRGSGYRMIWGVPILPNSYSPTRDESDTSGSAYGLAQGAAGTFDAHFVDLARSLVSDGQGSSIIRLGWEFNGGWFPWAANGSATQFVDYWRRIVTAMRSVPGQRFTFEWNPTLGDLSVGNLADYYPGDHYVDYIGADVYDQNWVSYPGAAMEFRNLKTESDGLNWLASFATQHGKPITLPEWGLGSGKGNGGRPITVADEEVAGGDDPTFVNDMSAWIKAHHVFEATFFDVGQSAVTPTTDPLSLAALASWSRSHRAASST
jgi:Glycosyl hydrolase family 26